MQRIISLFKNKVIWIVLAILALCAVVAVIAWFAMSRDGIPEKATFVFNFHN